MANTLRFKRGLVSTIPTALAGEPLFTTDTFDLYIGNGTTNTRFQKYIASGTTSQLLRGDGSLLTMPIVLTSPSNGQVLKYNGTSWVNDSDSGITGSGTTNYLPKFTGASTLGNSLVYDNGINVGIGTATPVSYSSPAQILNIVSSFANTEIKLTNSTTGNTSTAGLLIAQYGVDTYLWNGSAGLLAFGTSNTQRARITSTGNFIINNASVDNGLRLQVTGDGYFSGSLGLGITAPTTRLYVKANGANSTFDSETATDARLEFKRAGTRIGYLNWDSGFVSLQADSGNYLSFNSGGSEKMRLDASGNLGLGVTPSAWGSSYKAIQINSQSSFSGFNGNFTYVGTNLYIDGSDVGRYITTGATTLYRQSNGAHAWFYSASGTAGNAITFTQAMTLTANGRLLLGTTTEGAELLQVAGNTLITSSTPLLKLNASDNSQLHGIEFRQGAGFDAFIKQLPSTGDLRISSGRNSSWGGFITLYTDTTEKVRITSGGNVNIGTTLNTTGFSRLVLNGGQNGNESGIQVNYGGSTFGGFAITTLSAAGGGMAVYTYTGNVGSESYSERMRLDSSGNLGLGVAPAAWFADSKVFQFGLGGSLEGRTNLSNFLSLSTNARLNFSGNYVYLNTTTATTYQQSNGVHAWYNAPSGTAGNAITFTQAMTLFATGNLAVGTTTDAGYKLDVNGTMRVSGASTFVGNATIGLGNALESLLILNGQTYSGIRFQRAGTTKWAIFNNNAGTDFIDFYSYTTNTSLFTIAPTGAATFSSSVVSNSSITANNGIYASASGVGYISLLQGTAGGSGYVNFYSAGGVRQGYIGFSTTTATTDAGTLPYVAGTHAFTGAATFSSSVTAGGRTILAAGYIADLSGSGNDTGIAFGAGAIFSINGSGASATKNIGSSANPWGNLWAGAATFSSSVQAATAIAIGTTPDTNKPFKILKNINDTVGINFENTSTGSLAFSAIQMGTDVTGGTKFTNLVYSSSGVTASGVYNPDGTSLINNGSGGLNFLGNPIRMYTGGSNGSLRWDMTNDGFITQYTGTNPSTNATDGYRQYSADVTAGNAAPHFRTENGAIIKLYQETTGVGNSIISLGGGNAVLDDTTFDGYTLRQIVKALRNQGILA